MRCRRAIVGIVLSLVLGAGVLGPPAGLLASDERAWSRALVEQDWIRQEEARRRGAAADGASIRPEDDAAGGCDGVRTGTWGFHTAHERCPWWEVDLGGDKELSEIRVYNRTDGGFGERARELRVLVAAEGGDLRQVYEHDGTPFLGEPDGRPLVVRLRRVTARRVRLQIPGTGYLHLDEVEVHALGSDENIALGKPATQSSTSQWSVGHGAAGTTRTPAVRDAIARGEKLIVSLESLGLAVGKERAQLRDLASRLQALGEDAAEGELDGLHLSVRWLVRRLLLRNPLLDFDSILFVKRAPGVLPHMSDQYYGWWSRPGGGVFVLDGLKSEEPRVRSLTADWPPGSFLRPDISHDAERVLFAYCRYHPEVKGMEKVDKERLPEDAFYHIFEMRRDGSGVRQLTRGRYDDFDARYLPSGDVVFLSTRKGQFVQTTVEHTSATTRGTLPDSYVRCGGDSRRPCAVFTLHVMHADGSGMRPISAFENFEWTPAVAADGRILYSRWDYIDRFNGHYMSLWSTNPDGTNPQLVYGNFTTRPQAVFEARPIPGSRRLAFTACAHHSITGGSIVLLDPGAGNEEEAPLQRVTPEVPFPETEAWASTYYANPYPLSEEYFLVAWSDHRLPPHAGSQPVLDARNPPNALGIYLLDAFGNLELLYRDPEISSMYPLPIRSRPAPPRLASPVDRVGPREGRFVLEDVYEGLGAIPRGSVRRLRVVGVPPKTQPYMNSPSLGVSREDPGKFVLGTVPVERDGSAYFRVPSGVPVFFQALDEEGLAIRTMRTLTYVQPGQTLGCVGCHERRALAPRSARHPLALEREPSRLAPGPEGSWPLRFDVLVQPVLDAHCIRCHAPESEDEKAARLVLTAHGAYENLVKWRDGDLEKLAFERPESMAGDCPARRSRLLELLRREGGHAGVVLDPPSLERLVTWMDVYAQRLGSFSPTQEEELRALRAKWAHLLEASAPAATSSTFTRPFRRTEPPG